MNARTFLHVVAAALVAAGSACESPAPKADPAEIGRAAGEIYTRAMKDVTDLTRGRPEASVVKPQLERLRDEAVRRLVELGRRREALPAADREQVDSEIRKAITTLSPPLFEEFTTSVASYLDKDGNHEVHQIMTGFNVITQYACFELLKAQSPDEARRLGIP